MQQVAALRTYPFDHGVEAHHVTADTHGPSAPASDRSLLFDQVSHDAYVELMSIPC